MLITFTLQYELSDYKTMLC